MSKRRDPKLLSPGTAVEKATKRALSDANCEAAFREAIMMWLQAGPDAASALVNCVFSAMLHGVVLVREAAAMAAAHRNAVRAADGAYVFFQGLNGRERCVQLNPIARVVQARAELSEFPAEDALKSFVGWLDENGPDVFRTAGTNRSAQLAAVQRGARCFWSRHLPQLMISDAEAVLTLRPLRPEALARRATGQPLVRGARLAPSVFAAAASMLSTGHANSGSEVISEVVAIMTEGDGRKLGALRARQLQLLQPLLDEVADNGPALMLVFAASAFCERGTIKADQPSHSITSRYIRELAAMCNAASTLAGSLPALSASQRGEAYAQMLEHAGDRNDAAAALTNLDMYLVDATGCEPARPIDGGEEVAPRRPARYMTAHERAIALQLSVQVAPTPEQRAVVRTLGNVATTRPTRPGDLIDCRYEDLEISTGRAVLNRRRRAGLKAPKTSTAEGPIEFTQPSVVEALKELKALREGQAAMDGAPLWGRDLEESRRLYRRACATLDGMSKHATGDNCESFYSLRHGVASDDLLAAFELKDLEAAQRELKRASRRADHLDIATTVQSYFRLGPDVLYRRSTDAISSLLNSGIASMWSGVAVHALDQRVHRGTLPRIETLWQAISDAAPLSALKDITELHPCAKAELDLTTSPLALEDIAYSNVCTTLRFEDGKPVWDGAEVEMSSLSPWERRLVLARTRYAANWSESVRPAATRQPKLVGIVRSLRRFGRSAAARSATALWRASAKDGFLDVSSAARLTGWLEFLRACGVPASRLVIRLDPSMTPKRDVINAVFSKVTMQLPLIEEVPGGKGRPTAYLLICSKDVEADVSPPVAATSMAGFHALMLAACMLEDITCGTDGEAQDGPA